MESNHLSALKAKHAALDKRIDAEEARPAPDTIRLHEMKKEKLRLKEEISADA